MSKGVDMVKRGIWTWGIFYAVTLLLVGLLWALFSPAASILRHIGESGGAGPSVLIPLSFLLLSFLYAFLRGRIEGRKGHWIAAYGWLTGGTALAVVLLYLYLKQMMGV